MRRNDREITDRNQMIEVMRRCDVCRLALNDDGYPYIVPLNFGIQVDDEKITLYFHGALEGEKYDLIAKDNRAAFEMDCSHRLVPDYNKQSCTMEYESVIGHGRVELLPEAEKYDALCILMAQYHQEDFPFNKEVMSRTHVMKMVIEDMTGKKRMKRSR